MRPVTLCFSGLDPSGGAGLQADIEAIAAAGGHAAVVATALTIQDSQRVHGFQLVDVALMRAQAERVLADLPVAAVKLGMLGSAEAVAMVFDLLAAHPQLPVVMDPVLAANSGGSLAQDDLVAAMRAVLPRVTVLTPNTPEARRLGGSDDLAEAVRNLTRAGARTLWLKGGHEAGRLLRNEVHVDGVLAEYSEQPRLAGEFHGSGCTLAAALAAGLAAGQSVLEAMRASEAYLRKALEQADRPRDSGQFLPRRWILPT